MLTILVILSLLSFLRGRAVLHKVRQCFSSAHSPDTTINEDTKTRATPTRIGQRAEKMSILEGVSRGEQLPIKETRHRIQCMYVHIRPLATWAGATTKSSLHHHRYHDRRWERNALMCSTMHNITPHYAVCSRKTNSLLVALSEIHSHMYTHYSHLHIYIHPALSSLFALRRILLMSNS